MTTATSTDKRYVVMTPYGPIAIVGARLGYGTSQRTSHVNHTPDSFPPRGERCSGCRWAEARIFSLGGNGDTRYVVSTIGRSIIPGETDRIKAVWCRDAEDVLDALLITTHPRHRRGFRGDPRDLPLELPQPNEDALLNAGELDSDLDLVYRAWEREQRTSA